MSLFTPQSAPPAAPPAAPEAESVAAKESQRQRLLMIGGGVIGLLLVGFLAYHFLLSGGSVDPATGASGPTPQTTSAPTASATPAAPSLKTHTGTARNPFKALVVPTTDTTGSTGSTDGSGTSTGTEDGTTGTGTGTGTGTDSGTATSSVPLTIKLKKVTGTSSATITVQKQGSSTIKTYTPAIGETFGTYFRLTGFLTDSKTGEKAALLEYGDTILTVYPGVTDTVQ